MNIFLFGTGGHAKVIADIVEQQGQHRIVGLVSHDGLPSDAVPQYKVVASNANFLEAVRQLNVQGAIIALGNIQTRKNLADQIGQRLEWVSAIHPSAIIDKSVLIGPGTVVMAKAVINAGTVIGRHCIVNTSSSIDHDCTVGNFTHICPGVHIAGHVSIGEETWIGIGSAVIERVTIGNRVTAGAGSVIVNNISDHLQVMGVPAKEK